MGDTTSDPEGDSATSASRSTVVEVTTGLARPLDSDSASHGIVGAAVGSSSTSAPGVFGRNARSRTGTPRGSGSGSAVSSRPSSTMIARRSSASTRAGAFAPQDPTTPSIELMGPDLSRIHSVGADAMLGGLIGSVSSSVTPIIALSDIGVAVDGSVGTSPAGNANLPLTSAQSTTYVVPTFAGSVVGGVSVSSSVTPLMALAGAQQNQSNPRPTSTPVCWWGGQPGTGAGLPDQC